MVANGIVMSKICYLIQLWGGCEEYLLNALQVLQNRAARAVTGKSWFTPTRLLLKQCKWLSVRQLLVYQTTLLTHKVQSSGKPSCLASRMSTAHPYSTRQATAGCIRYGEDILRTSTLTQNSFRYRAAKCYNSIPPDIRQVTSVPAFKKKVKQWVLDNVPIS